MIDDRISGVQQLNRERLFAFLIIRGQRRSVREDRNTDGLRRLAGRESQRAGRTGEISAILGAAACGLIVHRGWAGEIAGARDGEDRRSGFCSIDGVGNRDAIDDQRGKWRIGSDGAGARSTDGDQRTTGSSCIGDGHCKIFCWLPKRVSEDRNIDGLRGLTGGERDRAANTAEVGARCRRTIVDGKDNGDGLIEIARPREGKHRRAIRRIADRDIADT